MGDGGVLAAIALSALTGSARQRSATVGFGTAFVLSVAVLVAVNWTSLAPDLAFYIDTSVDRVVLTPAFLAALGLGYLVPAARRERQDEGPSACR